MTKRKIWPGEQIILKQKPKNNKKLQHGNNKRLES